LICEAYHLAKDGLDLSHDQIADILTQWNKSELNSFLIEITRDILKYKDSSGQLLVPKIRDSAGQKGMGKWTAISALDFGVPVTFIGESVFTQRRTRGRQSYIKRTTNQISRLERRQKEVNRRHPQSSVCLKNSIICSEIDVVERGRPTLQMEPKLWRNSTDVEDGSIITSLFLANIKSAFDKNQKLNNLLVDQFFCNEISKCQDSWGQVVSKAVLLGIPTPCLSSALAFFDSYRSATLAANLIESILVLTLTNCWPLPENRFAQIVPEGEALFRLPVITLNISIALSILSFEFISNFVSLQ
jgi:6-phosphogluconate dehydrogenase